MKSELIGLCLLLAAPVLAAAQPPTPTAPIVSQMADAAAKPRLTVSSTALAGGRVPLENTSYAQSRSVDLAWSAGPAATRSYVVIAEDSDAVRDGAPITHWVAYNIAPSVKALPAGLPNTPEVAAVPGMKQVLTAAANGVMGYRGPRTPAGETHHYHFQVFALDAEIAPADGAGRTNVGAAMSGHILAAGEVVATFTGPPPAPAN